MLYKDRVTLERWEYIKVSVRRCAEFLFDRAREETGKLSDQLQLKVSAAALRDLEDKVHRGTKRSGELMREMRGELDDQLTDVASRNSVSDAEQPSVADEPKFAQMGARVDRLQLQLERLQHGRGAVADDANAAAAGCGDCRFTPEHDQQLGMLAREQQELREEHNQLFKKIALGSLNNGGSGAGAAKGVQWKDVPKFRDDEDLGVWVDRHAPSSPAGRKAWLDDFCATGASRVFETAGLGDRFQPHYRQSLQNAEAAILRFEEKEQGVPEGTNARLNSTPQGSVLPKAFVLRFEQRRRRQIEEAQRDAAVGNMGKWEGVRAAVKQSATRGGNFFEYLNNTSPSSWAAIAEQAQKAEETMTPEELRAAAAAADDDEKLSRLLAREGEARVPHGFQRIPREFRKRCWCPRHFDLLSRRVQGGAPSTCRYGNDCAWSHDKSEKIDGELVVDPEEWVGANQDKLLPGRQ